MTHFPQNPTASRGLAGHPITRAAFSQYLAATGSSGFAAPDAIARELWPRDLTAQRILTKADAAVQSTPTHPAIAGTSVADFFGNLPLSAASQLIAGGLTLSLDGQASITIPHRTGAPVVSPFVAEDAPIPIGRATTALTTLGPSKKAGLIVAFSRELAKRTAAEAVFRQILTEDAAASLDAAIFATTAATTAAPAGLLFGVTPGVGYPGGDHFAITQDIKALMAPYHAAGGGGDITFVTTPALAASLALHHPQFTWPVLVSTQIPTGRLIMLQQSAFVAGFGSMVEIDRHEAATLHFDDTTPLELVSAAGTVADPTRSLWQTDAIALRLTYEMAFAMRGAGRLQYLNGASW